MKRTLLLLTMKPSILVGGQAVIEGVMMRVPGAYATAVRDSEGKIHIQKKDFQSITRSEERRVGKECRSRWSRYH